MAERMDWFPFHAQDFLTSRTVLLMSDENVGRYVKLLAESWVHGPLPKDMAKMGRLIRLSESEMEEAWQEISGAFEETEEGYVNPRLEETRRKQIAKRQRYVNAGRKGAQTRWSQGDNSNASSDANAVANSSKSKKVEKEKEKEPTPKPPSAEERWTEEFNKEFWPRYPVRKGNRAKKDALQAWRGRMRDGVEPEPIIAAVKRYHRYCEVEGSIGTPFVMQARTFLNDPDNFDNPWTPPTEDEKPAPKRPDPPSPDSEAAKVSTEKPQQAGKRTNSLTLVGKDKPPDREKRDRLEAWKRKHPDELEALRDDAIDEIGMALEALRGKPDVARKLVETKVDEIIWSRKLGDAA